MFSFEPGLIIWSLASFAIVFIIFSKYIYPPLQNILEERQKIIDTTLTSAQEKLDHAQEMIHEARDKIFATNDESREIILSAIDRANRNFDIFEHKASEKYERLLQKKKEELDELENQFKQNLRHEVVNLTMETYHKIWQVPLTADQQEALLKYKIEQIDDVAAL